MNPARGVRCARHFRPARAALPHFNHSAVMSNAGIVMRQALGTPPATSPAAWLFSPDLLPFTAPVADTGLLTTRYDTGFAQAPVPGQANSLYVRGQNRSAASQKATVHLWSVQHNPLAGPFSDLLTPANWDATQFSAPTVSISAANQNDVALGAAPLVWTPPEQAAITSEYVLIAWLDGGGNPPPDWSTMQPFTKLDALRQYVEGNPSLVMLDTAYQGMFVRQDPGQGSRVSSPGATWNRSPDLILYSGAPAYDTTLLKRATDWSVHQPATVGQNDLYLRGVNTASSTVTARISFFYAVNTPGANNPLLSPAGWKSDAMTVGGTAQNYVTATGNASGDFMLNSQPLVWQPAAAPPPGSTYAVIAWIDNTNGSAPPPFASLPAFASLASLGEYVQGVRNMVLWDGSFGGLFVRQFAGQTAAQPGTGALTSPDIIVTGAAAAQDAGAFTAAASYSPGTISNAAVTGVPNFVYLRAINPNNGTQKARVYLYSGDTATPNLGNVTSQGFTVAGNPQNWVDLSADKQNQVLVSTVPVVWVPTSPASSQSRQFLLAYVDGSGDPQPPDFGVVGYLTLDAITTFVATQPQLSWVQVTNTPPSPQPSFATQYGVAAATAGRYLVGLQFTNLPVDGSVTVSIPGPDAADTLVIPSFHPPSPNAVAAWAVTYPAGFQTSAAVSYWAGATTPPTGANATLFMIAYPT